MALSASLAALIALLLLVRWASPPFLGSMFGVRDYQWEAHSFGVGITLGFLLLGGWIVGELFRTVNLPKLSGYLLFGLVAGPELPEFVSRSGGPAWVALLPAAHLGGLKLVDSLAIALIALMAGGELRFDLIRRTARVVCATLVADSVAVFVCVGVVVYFALDFLHWSYAVSPDAHIFLSVAIATLAISNSPAVVIAVLKETRAQGPMQEMSLAVTIAKDMLLIVVVTAVFALGVGVLQPKISDGATHMNREGAVEVVWHLLGSIGFGAAIGGAVGIAIARITVRLELLVVALGLAIALLSAALGFAPLLVALAAGFVLSNGWPRPSRPFFRSVDDLMLPVSVVFFAHTGASVDLRALSQVWVIALTLASARLAAVWFGASLGARIGGAPFPARRWAWTAFVPQAGVSLALAIEFRETFDSFAWSSQVYVLLVAIIALNELIGPPLFRFGLARCGEIRA